jgi:hypothetical protein
MGICSPSLKQYVIEPMLAKLGEHRPMASTLLLATCAFESENGNLLKSGKNFGLYGMDKCLHREIWDQWLVNDPELASRVRGMASQHNFLTAPHQELITNLAYATALAWCCYRMHNVQLPEKADPLALALCWQRYYRTDANSHALTKFVSTCKALLETPQNCNEPPARPAQAA